MGRWGDPLAWGGRGGAVSTPPAVLQTYVFKKMATSMGIWMVAGRGRRGKGDVGLSAGTRPGRIVSMLWLVT